MIRFAVATISLIGLIGSLASAQESVPRIQAFAGYSFVRGDAGGLTAPGLNSDLHEPVNTFGFGSNSQGWNAQAQYNADSWVSLAVDFAGRSSTPITSGPSGPISGAPSQTSYSFLAGPVLSYRTKSKATPFVHALFGYDRTTLSASSITGPQTPVSSAATTYTDFALALGGGFDYKLSRHFALRPLQLDYFHTSLNLNSFYGSAFGPGLFRGLSTNQRNLRLATGVVVRF
jgi:opacity protein-like surface antigen